jgi:hypothetical protein
MLMCGAIMTSYEMLDKNECFFKAFSAYIAKVVLKSKNNDAATSN